MIAILFIALFLCVSPVWAGESGNALIDNLPPDPGAAGKATLEGIDSDNDGVRDDVQRWIVMTYPNSEKTRAAIRQLAVAQQRFILDAVDLVKTKANALARRNAKNCLFHIRSAVAIDIGRKLRAVTLNTYSRSKSYIQADHHLSGQIYSNLPTSKQACNFDPDVMPN